MPYTRQIPSPRTAKEQTTSYPRPFRDEDMNGNVFWLPASNLLPHLPITKDSGIRGFADQMSAAISYETARYPVTAARPRPILTDFHLTVHTGFQKADQSVPTAGEYCKPN